MKAQIPAAGIMSTGDYNNSKFYEISCSCGQPDHNHTVEVEADAYGVNVNIWTTESTDSWTKVYDYEYVDNEYLYMVTRMFKDMVNGFIRRVSLTWKIWVKGYVQYQVTTTMTEQEALNYAEALKSAIEDVKQFRENEKKK
jgi:hypothetical protein